ncbi:MAG: hypothetical protein DYH15_09425 [Nitrosomonas sp. PRO4]|nr:hypothetical protein [Nitrosomonas sp. PRO4]
MPLDLFINIIEPRASRLKNLPNRIWIFGGPFENCSKSPPKSLRDSFWRRLLSQSNEYSWTNKLERPEDYEDWWAFSGYKDLLQFERDACYLAHATILFAESPGSLAELGALSLDESILSKLLVVVESKYTQESMRKSFLNLGPLKRVEDNGFKCVIGTNANHTRELSEDDFETITHSIDTWLPPLKKTASLCITNPTHRLLLLADIIDLLYVCKKNDVQKIFLHFSSEITEQELEQSLKLLDFLGLIKLEYRGYECFLVSKKTSGAPWIDYKAQSNKNFDRIRFKLRSFNQIKEDHRRFSIYKGQS